MSSYLQPKHEAYPACREQEQYLFLKKLQMLSSTAADTAQVI